ncbi:neprilysin-1-like [Octopus sinensis]|uniref:Neprilysin-1-like n=1 Tax=Octopus sinensis TaxID=2607531 RepID=A0A6P7TJ19_9MOLL|nr:neprilysin-1-like [Octopus sinensis]
MEKIRCEEMNENSASCKLPINTELKIIEDPVFVQVHVAADRKDIGRNWTHREKWLLSICIFVVVVLVAFVTVTFVFKEIYNGDEEICLTTDCIKTAAELLEDIDFSVDPCDDFYQYTCGNWERRNIIPEDMAAIGNIERQHRKLQIIIKRILETPPNQFDGNATTKAKTLYKSCMNMSQIQYIGDKPFHHILRSFGGWPVITDQWDADKFSIESTLAKLYKEFHISVILNFNVSPDDKNSSTNIIHLDQAHLGMPSRDYYLDPNDIQYVDAYENFMVSVSELLGADRNFSGKELREVIQFETELANITNSIEDRVDMESLYTKISIAELNQMAPEFDWLKYFRSIISPDVQESEQLVTIAPNYLKNMSQLLSRTHKRIIANYIFWIMTKELCPHLTHEYRLLDYRYRKVLEGIRKEKTLWESCVSFINTEIGHAVGALFVSEHFKKENKDIALEMIQNIRNAFNKLLDDNTWMDEETRKFAKEKANAMIGMIGYPEFILKKSKLDKFYEMLEVDPDSYFRSVHQIKRYKSHNQIKELREPVDREKWLQDPAVINAYYNPNTNDIVFPAGILQPVFYSNSYPKSLNYGGIGIVIGHEITHGFDNRGRKFDKTGNLKQWWKNETIEAFNKKAQCMIDQYSSFVLKQAGLKIRGINTLGENIADNGGLKQAYQAYQQWVADHGAEPPLPGLNLTHEQLFFVNYARIWCGKMRDEEALNQIRTEVHSPGPIRVKGPLSNSVEFSKVYNCPLGSNMNPEHKCQVW